MPSVVVDVRQLGELVRSWRSLSTALLVEHRSANDAVRARVFESCAEALESLCVEAGAVKVDAAGRVVRR